MKNLLIITQKVDQDDDLLGFFIGWLREFSRRFNKVFVITLAKGSYVLPGNVYVYSLGKERGASKISQFLNFYKFLFRLTPGSSGIFCHMSPIFAIASWPAVFLFRKKIILWYLHRSVTLRLKLAEKLVYKIATASKESLNIKSGKIVELGHGINIERFKILRSWKNETGVLKILSVGRISKIKDYETLIKAAKILKEKGLKFKIKIVGRPVMKGDFDYFENLKQLVQKLNLADSVKFAGFVPYSQIDDYYKKADIFINLSPTGGIDKAVLETMVSGSLVLVSNEAFKRYFGGYDLFFEHGDTVDLAERIIKLSKLPAPEIEKISNFFRQSVGEHHDLKNTISSISLLFYQ